MIFRLDSATMREVDEVARRTQDRVEGRPQPSIAHPAEGDRNLDVRRRALAAEAAVAYYLGQEWLRDYTGPKSFDVAPNIEVRNTTPGRALYIKRREVIEGPYEKPASARYVLTWTGNDPTQIGIVGWITLGDAMLEASLHEADGKVYGLLFPAHRLRKMGELRDALRT